MGRFLMGSCLPNREERRGEGETRGHGDAGTDLGYTRTFLLAGVAAVFRGGSPKKGE